MIGGIFIVFEDTSYRLVIGKEDQSEANMV